MDSLEDLESLAMEHTWQTGWLGIWSGSECFWAEGVAFRKALRLGETWHNWESERQLLWLEYVEGREAVASAWKPLCGSWNQLVVPTSGCCCLIITMVHIITTAILGALTMSGPVVGTFHTLSYMNFPQTPGDWHCSPHFTSEDTEVHRILWLAQVIQLVSGGKGLETNTVLMYNLSPYTECIVSCHGPLFPLDSSTQQSANPCLLSWLLLWLSFCSADARFRAVLSPQRGTQIRHSASFNRNLYPRQWNSIEISYWMNDGSKWIAHKWLFKNGVNYFLR